MNFDIRPFLSEGGWWTSHGSYYGYSHAFCDEYKEIVRRIECEEDRLRKEAIDACISAEDIGGFVENGVWDMHDEAYKCATSCHLFACMALEGFLNLYGVRRLGEDFYQKNLERLGITEKLALIGMCCNQWCVDDDSQVFRDFRSLFDARNRFVHPKTREFKRDRASQNVYIHPSNIPVDEIILRLERCIDFFIESDVSLPRDFLFRKCMDGSSKGGTEERGQVEMARFFRTR